MFGWVPAKEGQMSEALKALALIVLEAVCGQLLLLTCPRCTRLVISTDEMVEDFPFGFDDPSIYEQYVCSCDDE